MNIKTIFVITLLGISLGGCASFKKPRSCPVSNGLACARVDQINQMVNRGQLTHRQNSSISDSRGPYHNFSTPYPSTVKSGEPLWKAEKVMQIWVAPFEDLNGNYHEPSVIDTVVTKGHWLHHPPTAVKGEDV